jgi:hypothetical protein
LFSWKYYEIELKEQTKKQKNKEEKINFGYQVPNVHVTKSVVTNQGGKVTILWNEQVQTDRTIPNNKPDIIIRDSEKGTCMLIDVAISRERNVIKKEAEKILKYRVRHK